jgi:hypothetical protein
MYSVAVCKVHAGLTAKGHTISMAPLCWQSMLATFPIFATQGEPEVSGWESGRMASDFATPLTAKELEQVQPPFMVRRG